MKNIYTMLIISILIVSCKKEQIKTNNTKQKIVSVTPDVETEAISSNDDAADDSCIWINPINVMESEIIATNKKKGLIVYNLQGKKRYSYPIGKVNNVDIRNGFLLNGKSTSIVTSSNKTSNTITVHKINPLTGELINVQAKPLKSNFTKIYGLGMYKSPISQKIYVFINDKKGNVEQWELFEIDNKIDGKIVRTFSVGAQTEGIVADDFHKYLYIGEEDSALWKYKAEPDTGNEREIVITTKDHNIQSDFEGVTLYDSGKGEGYIIASSQGNSSYAVLDRVTNKYIGSFKIDDTKEIDGTYDTDGIDVTSIAFNKTYPKGFFIAQDGANTKDRDSLNQNFKIVNWTKIKNALNLK